MFWRVPEELCTIIVKVRDFKLHLVFNWRILDLLGGYLSVSDSSAGGCWWISVQIFELLAQMKFPLQVKRIDNRRECNHLFVDTELNVALWLVINWFLLCLKEY